MLPTAHGTCHHATVPEATADPGRTAPTRLPAGGVYDPRNGTGGAAASGRDGKWRLSGILLLLSYRCGFSSGRKGGDQMMRLTKPQNPSLGSVFGGDAQIVATRSRRELPHTAGRNSCLHFLFDLKGDLQPEKGVATDRPSSPSGRPVSAITRLLPG